MFSFVRLFVGAAPLGNRADFADGKRRLVGGEGHGFRMEIAT